MPHPAAGVERAGLRRLRREGRIRRHSSRFRPRFQPCGESVISARCGATADIARARRASARPSSRPSRSQPPRLPRRCDPEALPDPARHADRGAHRTRRQWAPVPVLSGECTGTIKSVTIAPSKGALTLSHDDHPCGGSGVRASTARKLTGKDQTGRAAFVVGDGQSNPIRSGRPIHVVNAGSSGSL